MSLLLLLSAQGLAASALLFATVAVTASDQLLSFDYIGPMSGTLSEASRFASLSGQTGTVRLPLLTLSVGSSHGGATQRIKHDFGARARMLVVSISIWHPKRSVPLCLFERAKLFILKMKKSFRNKSRSLSSLKFLVPMAGLEPARTFRSNGF